MFRGVMTQVTLQNQLLFSFLVLDSNRKLVSCRLFPEDASLIGNIYVGKVENIVPNINAAFIRIGDRKCFLPLDDAIAPIYTHKFSNKPSLAIGDELLVQVVRDAIKTKDAVVSTKLTFSGNYTVLTTENTKLGISHKLSDEFRKTILSDSRFQLEEDRNYGIILRTNAGEADLEQLVEEFKQQISAYHSFLQSALHQLPYTLCYSPESAYLEQLKHCDWNSVDFVYFDDKERYQEACEKLPWLCDKFQLYDDSAISLSSLYSIRNNLSNITERLVWLESGANIIIEQLETLTFIDVNTAKNMKKTGQSFLSVNKEAAEEIARQIRLRNISGMILVDFINLKPNEQEELLSYMRKLLKEDSIPSNALDITKLGLMELTRKKTSKSILEILKQ